MTSWALPATTATVPSTALPSLNVTLPSDGVIVEGDDADTVAVRVTGIPRTDGLSDEARPVDVVALETVSLEAVDALGAKSPAPP